MIVHQQVNLFIVIPLCHYFCRVLLYERPMADQYQFACLETNSKWVGRQKFSWGIINFFLIHVIKLAAGKQCSSGMLFKDVKNRVVQQINLRLNYHSVDTACLNSYLALKDS